MAWTERLRTAAGPTGLHRTGMLVVLGLMLVGTLVGIRYSPMMVLLPLPVIFVLAVSYRVLSTPVLVLCLFLAVAVNLDYFQLGEKFSADVATSIFLIYAMMFRIGVQRQPLFANRVERVYLVYVLAILASVVLSLNFADSVKNWVRDLEYLILIHFLAGLALTGANRKTITGVIILSSLIPCFVGVFGMVTNNPEYYGNWAPIGEKDDLVPRVFSTLAHPGMFAQYLCTVGILTLGMIVDGRWFKRRYLIPLFALQSFLLYFTFTRAMWGEYVIAIAILAWLYGYRRFVLAGIPLGLVGLAVVVPSFLARWSTAWEASTDNSMIWRFGLWMKALRLVPARPWFGSGPDTFIDYVDFLGFGAHNTWLKLLVETGVIGLGLYVALMVVVWKALREKLRTVGIAGDPILASTIAIFVGYLVSSWVSDTFEVPPATIYLWTLLGMVFCWTGRDPEPASPGSEQP
jgi:O-antigen ligase